MSADEQTIICRRCGETVRMTVGNCPRCGAEIRGRRGPLGALIIGVIIIVASISDLGQLWVFGVLGVIIAFGGAYFLYDRRKRIRNAGARGQ